jgi:hypothetical protein
MGYPRRYVPALVGAALLSLPSLADAVDGVVEINQARVVAGGVTPSDSPGFPVTIDQGGSYRLTSNLTVPNENTSAIQADVDDVTLDLKGFSIVGPSDLAGPCGIGLRSPDRDRGHSQERHRSWHGKHENSGGPRVMVRDVHV